MRPRRRLLANAAGATVEQLEGRMLLSSMGNDPQGYIDRLAGHQLSGEEMAARGLEMINWRGAETWVKKGEWIVGVDVGRARDFGGIEALIEALGLGAEFKGKLGAEHTGLVKLPEGVGYEELSGGLRGRGAFVWAGPNGLIVANASANDPKYGVQYGLNNTGQDTGTYDADIDAPEAWDVTTGSSDVIVAVLDSGVDLGHPDLAANIWTNPNEIAGDGIDNDGNAVVDDVHGARYRYDPNNPQLVIGDGNVTDDNYHGTHVAGVIAAVGNNGVAVAGVGWSTKILPVKIMPSNAAGENAWAVAGINYVLGLKDAGVNIKVVNASWSGQAPGSGEGVFDVPIQDLQSRGILFVNSSGRELLNVEEDQDPNNEGVQKMYPASLGGTYDNMVVVAATDRNDNLAGCGGYGPNTVLLGAPGVRIMSTMPRTATQAMTDQGQTTTYGFVSGASVSTAFASGVAALAWSVKPNATYLEVTQALKDGADPVEVLRGKVMSGGRLNARRTVDLIRAPQVATGTSDAPDSVTVRMNGTTVEVLVNSQTPTQTWSSTDVSWLTIDGQGGNDTITVSSAVTLSVSVIGGAGNDTITGGGGPDRLDGGEGADVLTGESGDDTLVGGAGNDTLNGGNGRDVLRGDEGDDSLTGDWGSDTYAFRGTGLGTDTVTEAANAESDTLDFGGLGEAVDVNLANSGGTAAVNNTSLVLYLSSGTGIENVRGSDFGDTVVGNNRGNVLFGNWGHDSLDGGPGTSSGADTLHGGVGNDTLSGGRGNDVYVWTGRGEKDYGLGKDVVTEAASLDMDTLDFTDYRAAVIVDLSLEGEPQTGVPAVWEYWNETQVYLSSGMGLENVKGSYQRTVDEGWMPWRGDWIVGNGRNNSLWGNDGDDTMDGASGADMLSGGTGVDTVDYSAKMAGVNVSLDNMPNDGESGEHDNVLTDVERVAAGYYNDTLTGGSAGCTLLGGAGNDSLVGTSGADSLDGGAGDDYLTGASGNDELWAGPGNDTVYGGIGHDSIYGEEGMDYLYGGGYGDYWGNDSIEGGDDFDVIYGDYGDDKLYGESPFASTGAGDYISGDDGNDSIFGGPGGDYAYGGYGNDSIEGEDGNDYMHGNDGNDTIVGGAGSDQLYGDAGDDWLDSSDWDSTRDTVDGGDGDGDMLFDYDLEDYVVPGTIELFGR